MCCVTFRRVSGVAGSAFPGAVAGVSRRYGGPQAGGLQPADPQAANLRHHQRPHGHQSHRETVGLHVQVDVSQRMLLLLLFTVQTDTEEMYHPA